VQPGDNIRNIQRQTLADKGFIEPTVVNVQIAHPPYMDADQFGLQMSVPDVVSGCFDVTPLEYEAKFVDPYYLDIKVKRYRRLPQAGTPANCKRQNKMSTALMALSKADLQKRGTQEIRFSTATATDTFKIEINDTQVDLIPRSMLIFKAQGLTGPLKDRMTHSFGAGSIVALQVPMAKPSDNVYSQIMQFATSRALSPAQGYQTTGQGQKTFYFYDVSGRFASEIDAGGGYAELGQINVNRPYDGPQGRTATSVPLSVFVTRPDTQL
jgi:hypothetical protein